MKTITILIFSFFLNTYNLQSTDEMDEKIRSLYQKYWSGCKLWHSGKKDTAFPLFAEAAREGVTAAYPFLYEYSNEIHYAITGYEKGNLPCYWYYGIHLYKEGHKKKAINIFFEGIDYPYCRAALLSLGYDVSQIDEWEYKY